MTATTTVEEKQPTEDSHGEGNGSDLGDDAIVNGGGGEPKAAKKKKKKPKSKKVSPRHPMVH